MPYSGAKKMITDLKVCEIDRQEKELLILLNDTLKYQSEVKDSIIFKLQENYDYCSEANRNGVKVIKNQNDIIDELRSQVRRQKKQKIIAIISGGAMVILTILALH